MQPTAYIIGGPNGAGKTTFAMRYLPAVAHCAEFINADLIARGLSPLNERAAQVRAGRLLLRLVDELSARRVDFAFETTFSGTGHVRTLRRLANAGYRIEIYFLWIPSAEFSAKRVAERVANGGHDIPDAAVQRRYPRSIRNFLVRYLPLADYAAVWDNSIVPPRPVYERDGQSEAVFHEPIWQHMKEYAG